jgi:RNA polymerase sigma factor for flagellar operon FliA
MDADTREGEDSLWQQLRQHRATSAREALYVRYTPWASAVARRVHRRFPRLAADRDDFIQNANMGLLEAIDRYDPGRGIAFQAYAMARVRGSVFNGLRAILGGQASERYQERLDTLQDREDDPFDALVGSIVGLGIGYLLDDAANALAADPQDGLRYTEDREIATRLARALDQLPPRHRIIVVRHYFEFTPFIDLAGEWGLSKGRIAQLHRAALEGLKVALAQR